MALIRRQIAAFGPITTTRAFANIGQRDDATQQGAPADAQPTIAQFSTGLNGVNQPMNLLFSDVLYWTLGIIALVVLGIRIAEFGVQKIRHVSAMTAPAAKQRYWTAPHFSWMPSLRKHLIYSPLWKKRHNREMQLSKAISVGTLPSRIHFMFLTMYFVSNLVYTFVVDWHQPNKFSLAAEIRGRSGTLAAVNMIPLVIFAGRNNPLISLLKISFDTYNLLHRWMGRIIVVETLIHMIAWFYAAVPGNGWKGVGHRLTHESFIASGFCGAIALIVLLLLSLSPVRHAFYETFLNTHIMLAFIIFTMTLVHCASAALPGGLPQLPMIIAVFVLWFADRLARMFRLVSLNWSPSRSRFTTAIVEPMPGDTCRVTMHLPKYVDVLPGTHAYIRFMGINPWENHPFSIAWVEHFPDASRDSIVDKTYTQADVKRGTTSLSFVIGSHSGFTKQLYAKACKGGARSVRIKAAVEGPYAGHHSLDSYGHVVLFAGSTGITHQLSYLKPLIEGYNNGTIATRRVTLVWIIRDTEALQWIRPWMDEILKLPNRRDILTIKLFITRPKNTKEIYSPSTTVQMLPGRPNTRLLLRKEVEEQVGAMCVTVCGPGALADDVRQAVREVQDEKTECEFVEESFTW